MRLNVSPVYGERESIVPSELATINLCEVSNGPTHNISSFLFVFNCTTQTIFPESLVTQ